MSEPTAPIENGPDGPETAAPEGRPRRPRGTRRRFAKRWTRRIIVAVAAIIATVLFTVFTVDIGTITIAGKSLKSEAEARASKYLKRQMTIGGIEAYVTPGRFAFTDVEIKGPFPDSRPFFKAKRITAYVPWWTLFSKELHVEVKLTDWRMVVEKFPDGEAHLPRLTPEKPGTGKSWYQIKGLAVYANDGEFVYDDGVTPWSVKGPGLQFSIVRVNNLNTYMGMAQFTDGLVKIQNFVPMTASFKTWFHVDGGIVRLKHIDLLTDGAESHLDGYVNFKNWPEQEYRIQSTVDFNRMRELFWSNATWRVDGTGEFSGIFKLFKGGRDLSGQFTSPSAALGIGDSEWQFGDLHGNLQWTQDKFVVSHADSDLLGGRMRLAYGIAPLGAAAGATATFTAEYEDIDLHRFTRQLGFTSIEPEGRMRGQVAMAWKNNRPIGETVQGSGTTVVRAPRGEALASPTLPAEAPELVREANFQKYRPFDPFPVAADTSYHFSGSSLDFDPSWVATPSTYVSFHGHARGGPVSVPFHVTSHDWQKSDRLFAAIMTQFTKKPMGAIEVYGRGTFDGVLTKAFNAPRIEGKFDADQMWAWKETWGHATGDVVVENSYLTVTNGVVTHPGGGRVLTSGKYSLGYPRNDGGDEIDAQIRAENMPLLPLKNAFGLIGWPVEGDLELADLHLKGAYERPSGNGTMQLGPGTAWAETYDQATGDLQFEGDGSLRLRNIVVSKGPGRVTGNAWLSWSGEVFSIVATGNNLQIEELSSFKIPRAPLTGVLSFTANGSGRFDAPVWDIKDILVPDLYAGGEGIGVLRANVGFERNILTIKDMVASSPITDRLQIGCHGSLAMSAPQDADLFCDFTNTSFDPYFKFVGTDLPFNKAIASGSVTFAGPLRDTSKFRVTARLTDAQLKLFNYDLKNTGELQMSFRDSTFRLDRVAFEGINTNLTLSGSVDSAGRTVNLAAQGKADLAVLQAFYPSLSAKGATTLQAALKGGFDSLALTGEANITNGELRHYEVPHRLELINGPIKIEQGRISVDGLTAVIGDGPVVFSGGITLNGYKPEEFNLEARGESLHLRVPKGLQSTVRARLSLRGPVTYPTLSGAVDVLAATYALRLQSQAGYFDLFTGGIDQGPVLPVPVEPTPSSFQMGLDIRITARDVPFVDNREASAEVQGNATINVTGTLDRPVIQGRVEATRGQWVFAGNRYKLLDGSIEFLDALNQDPFFDLTAETDVHQQGQRYRVRIGFTGTKGKWIPRFESDPWLSQFQIVSLLLGETPDFGQAELRAQGDPQELQQQALQSAMFTILASPISANIGGAIQRVTTVTAQIVPLLYGNEANLQQLSPSARIVFGRRISDRVYVTYSRTLSGAQNEIILVEIDQSEQVQWVLSRNEDRSFAIDFRLRKVFR